MKKNLKRLTSPNAAEPFKRFRRNPGPRIVRRGRKTYLAGWVA